MPDPDDALADALVEVSELVVAMGDPRADRAELDAEDVSAFLRCA